MVKTAGGAASQCLALMSAIYISRRIGRPFLIRHYPYGTGGYYPLAIEGLLDDNELDEIEGTIRGLEITNKLVIGGIIEEHPILKRGITYEKFLATLRRFGLDLYINRLRGEWCLNGSRARLDKVPQRIRYVSGGYMPFLDLEVRKELAERFKQAHLPSLFAPANEDGPVPSVVIHYRLGDKRTTFSHPGIGGEANGIVDPNSFRSILEIEGLLHEEDIYVISDEPLVAQGLLKDVGIIAKINPVKGDLWSDLALMAKARLLICPWSTVSQFVAACLVGTERKVYYPDANGAGIRPDWEIDGLLTFPAKYLPPSHEIYQGTYRSEPDAHRIYDRGSPQDLK